MESKCSKIYKRVITTRNIYEELSQVGVQVDELGV